MTGDSADFSAGARALTPAIVLALLAILFGFVLGGLFGVAEDAVKDRLRASADSVLETVYAGDAERAASTVGRSWNYLKRSHLHGGGIGAAALASILALGLLCRVGRLEKASAIALGLGALIYPIFWLAAGFSAPALGSTGAAKEALNYLAIPGAGLCLLGLIGVLVSVVRSALATRS